MELLGSRNNPHTRPLPGRWTPFQNLMSRPRFLPSCATCSGTDTISMNSDTIAYNGLVSNRVAPSSPQTSRGYYGDVSNMSSGGTSEQSSPRLHHQEEGRREDSDISDSDTPSNRSYNHLGLVFSPGRRSQLTRQQLAWMQALSKNINNTPPSLREASALYSSGSDVQNAALRNANDSITTHIGALGNTTHVDAANQDILNSGGGSLLSPPPPSNRAHSPYPPSPSSSVHSATPSEQAARVAITQRLLTDPSSDEHEQALLQSTTVDVYGCFGNENTMFNFDEHHQNATNEEMQKMENDLRLSPIGIMCDDSIPLGRSASPQYSIPRNDEGGSLLHIPRNGSPDNVVPEINPASETGTHNPPVEATNVSETTVREQRANRPRNESETGNETSEIASSNVTDETTIGTSQESAEETVMLDYSENFTFTAQASQNPPNPVSPLETGDILSQNRRPENEETETRDDSDNSSERNPPMHLISLFENPPSSSSSGNNSDSSNCGTQTTEERERPPEMRIRNNRTGNNRSEVTDSLTSQPDGFESNNSRNRWATRIIRSNLQLSPNRISTTNSSQTVRSNASNTSSGGGGQTAQLQNWYIYDPRLVPGNRQQPRLNLHMQYRGIQQMWSMPAIISPPDYDDLSTLHSDNENEDATTLRRPPVEPPPPYTEGAFPPPTYDEAIFDAMFIEDELLGLHNPVYVEPSQSLPASHTSTLESNSSRRRRSSSNRQSAAYTSSALPNEILEELESVLNMNSSPLASPGDTLTSCATQPSHASVISADDLDGLRTNSNQTLNSISITHNNSLHSDEHISSIPTSLAAGSRNQSRGENSLNIAANNRRNGGAGGERISDHEAQLQNLRSALNNHLQALQRNPIPLFQVAPPSTSNAEVAAGSNPRQRHSTAPANQSLASSQRESTNLEPPLFGRPAIMYNRSMWSISPTRANRTNFSVGGAENGGNDRLLSAGQRGSLPDVSGVEL